MNQQASSFPYIKFALFLCLEVAVFMSHKMVSMHGAGQGIDFYTELLGQPWIWISLLLAALQFYFWTSILAKADMGYAYALSSLSYPLTMIAATLFFNEHLPALVWAGGGLITLGVIVLGF